MITLDKIKKDIRRVFFSFEKGFFLHYNYSVPFLNETVFNSYYNISAVLANKFEFGASASHRSLLRGKRTNIEFSSERIPVACYRISERIYNYNIP